MAQKRALVAKQIQTLRREVRNKAQSLLGKQDSLSRGYDRLLTSGHLDTLEILLLLLWRHLRYYSEARPAGSQIQASTPHITRLVTSMDVESFRAEVPRKLSALLQRLDALNVVNCFSFHEMFILTWTHYNRIPNRWQRMGIGGSTAHISKQYASGSGRRRDFGNRRMMGKARCRLHTIYIHGDAETTHRPRNNTLS